MKNLPLLIIMLLPLFAESQLTERWQNTFGGSGEDRSFSINHTSDGGSICGGWSTSGISGDKTEYNRGQGDFWVVKLDATGNIDWQKTIGGAGQEAITSISQTSDGGYICGGYSNSGISGDKTEASQGLFDYWIVKLGATGNIEWQNTIGGNWDDIATSISQTSDGGYICIGYSYSDISGDKTENSQGLHDYWVLKLDPLGNIQWQNTIGGSEYDYPMMISQTADGGYICGGYSFSNASGDKTENSQGSADYWVVKLNATGQIQWQNTIGGNNNDQLKTISQTSDGGYICGGFSGSNISGDKTQKSFGSYDSWILKLDSTGNIQWQNTVGGSNLESDCYVTQSTDGGFICGVTSISNISGNKTENGQGDYDFWIIKLDNNGNLLWQNNIGGNGLDILCSIYQKPNGEYVCAGFSSSQISGDKKENSTITDYWVFSFAENYNLINGFVFCDLNSNSQYDAGDAALKHFLVTEPNSNSLGISGENGLYYVAVFDTGNFSVIPFMPINYFTVSPASHSAYFPNMQQTDSLNHFAFQPNGTINDLCLTITPTTAFRPGFNAGYVISYENVGSTVINNASVVFHLDNNISFVSSNVIPSNIFPDSIIWNIGTLTPFQSANIVVTVSVNVGVAIGTVINSGAVIYPVAGDTNPTCNTHYWEVAVTGSFDPNDILVDRDTLYNYEISNPPHLEYIIRFQNTGNDTAFTVKILNPLDTTMLQLNTFDFVAASHPVDIRFVYHERNMEFLFNNILLPDSNVNEPLSHGFVRYRIKPKTTLAVGDTIRNKAHIYFDFNDPIATNTAMTRVVLPTGVAAAAAVAAWEVFPNPSSGDVNVSFTLKQDALVETELFNATGQLVFSDQSKYAYGSHEMRLPVADLPKGVYYVRLSVNGSVMVKKVVKL